MSTGSRRAVASVRQPGRAAKVWVGPPGGRVPRLGGAVGRPPMGRPGGEGREAGPP
ncbi:MAG: hypothetical protein OXK78_09340 [Caldilineaceae bacterium]|nr:hypothetical protein [Caldilineaceae bacterium]